MPKVSFIVIGYNIDKYIERCLKTIKNQTLENIEIIFVDDGSTDNTLLVVKELSQNDARIKIIRQENSGANAARKAGLKSATGEYVFFVDGDDWIDLNSAKDLYSVAIESNYDIVAFSYFMAYDNDAYNIKKENINTGAKFNKQYLELIIQQKISHNLWNKFFKREFLIQNGFFNIPSITMGDDLVANVQLGVNNPNVLIINDAYYYYYQRLTSVTKQISPKVLEIKEALEGVESILKANNLLSTYQDEVNYLWFRHAYFCLVVLSSHKSSYIQRELYELWKEKKNIYKVKYILFRIYKKFRYIKTNTTLSI